MSKTFYALALVFCCFINYVVVIGHTNNAVFDQSSKHSESLLNENLKEQDAQQSSETETNIDCALCIDPCEQLRKERRGKGDSNHAKKERVWVIDARSGSERFQQPCKDENGNNIQQEINYIGSPKVTVYVINMNPFIYDYAIAVNKEILPEEAQNIFLQQLGGPLFDFIGGGGSTTGGEKAGAGERGREDKEVCAANLQIAKDVLADYDANFKTLEARYMDYKSRFDDLKSAYTSLLDPFAECAELCKIANKYTAFYQNRPDKYEFEDTALEVIKENNDLSTALADLSKCPVGGDFDQTRDRLRKAKRETDKLIDKLNVLCKDLFKENRAKLAAMDRAVKQVAAHPNLLLIQKFQVGGYTQPTKVTINVTSKPRKPVDAPLQSNETGPQPCAEAKQQADKQKEPTKQRVIKETTTPPPASDGNRDGNNPDKNGDGSQPDATEQTTPAKLNRMERPRTVKPSKPLKENGNSIQSDEGLIARRESVSSPANHFVAASIKVSDRLVSPSDSGASDLRAKNNSTSSNLPSRQAKDSGKKNKKATPQKSDDNGEPQDTGEKGSDDTQTKTYTGIFDSRRFSLSGGIVYTSLEKREFQPVLGLERDFTGMPVNGNTLTNVIGLKDNSGWTLGPLLLLNTRLWETRNFGIHASVGITGKRDKAGTDIDYFFGPSFSFLNRLVFLTPGVYVGKQQRLAGEAFIGAPVEDDTVIPVVKEYQAKPGFSLTFRILPLPK